jgi:hypothetical protein
VKRVIFILLIAVGCSPSATKTAKQKELNPKPSWLELKPQGSLYFVGIGHSSKAEANDYLQKAKKSALEDLVSEIKVTVSGTSILSKLDANKSFQESYEKIIQTKATDDIQEFEQVDSWQDDRNYWVYYRLSKQRYKEIKDELKRNAVSKALDFFTKAKQAERAGDLVQGLNFYFQGFVAIEKYLAEPIQLDFEGNTILLTNEIITNIQLLLDKIQIKVNPAELLVNRRIAESEINAVAKAFSKEKLVSGLPLSARFEKGAGVVYPTYSTNLKGEAKILVTKISAKDVEQTVKVSINLLSFLGSDSSAVASLLVKQLNVPSANLILKVVRPLIYISSLEKTFGVEKSNQQLTNRIKNFMTNAGFEITPEKQKAQFLMDITADAEKGAVSGSIYITYVTAIIKVVLARDNKEIYSTTLDRIKGFSLDYDRSSQEAYNKSLEILEKDKMPLLLNSILQ